MKVSPELAKRMIQAQGFRRLQCFTPDRADLLYRAEGTPAELCDAVDEVVAMVGGLFRLECDTPRPKDETGRSRAGRTPDHARPMVVIVAGGFNAGHASQDPALAARLARLEELLTREEEEEEEEEEPATAALAERLVGLLEKALDAKAPTPAPARQAAAPVIAGPVADGPDDARAMARALANLKATDPQAFAMYKAHLLANYGAKD